MQISISALAIATLALGTAAVARSAPTADPRSPGTLMAAGTMQAARAAHSATALLDGRVLVAGGFATQRSPAAAELYDPAASRFQSLPPMITSRFSHTATRLPDGRVLLAGGYGTGGVTLASMELFDPTTRKFTSAGSLTEARADHVAILLDDGRVLLAAGLGPDWTFLASAEIFDPRTGRSTPTGAMAMARQSHVGVKLHDGRVLVVGGNRGRRANIVLHASAEVYDPTTGTFSPTGAMGTPRHKHDAVVLPDGRVLVTGGSDARDNQGMYDTSELYDPSVGIFRDGPRMQHARYKHARSSIVLPSGMVLVGGGAPRAEVYDPHRNRFTLVGGQAQLPGQFGAVAPLPDGGALITGGYGGDIAARASAWRYRP